MATRRYGQHFLTDQAIISKIVAGAGVKKSDAVLEIGPGRGILTRALAAAAKKVLTVEIDRRLQTLLTEDGLPENVELVRGDALTLEADELASKLGSEWKLVANLPYEITSRTLEKFLPMRTRSGAGPVSVTLMLQKEVGERILAKPGQMNRLALFCGYFSEPSMLFSVARGSFSPPPKVDSCVIRLDVRPEPLLTKAEEALFFRVISASFASKRKQIKNTALSALGPDASLRLLRSGVSPEARPEEITLNQWVTMVRAM